jgi:hypothetical protein
MWPRLRLRSVPWFHFGMGHALHEAPGEMPTKSGAELTPPRGEPAFDQTVRGRRRGDEGSAGFGHGGLGRP